LQEKLQITKLLPEGAKYQACDCQFNVDRSGNSSICFTRKWIDTR
jgi:hypothetical protein